MWKKLFSKLLVTSVLSTGAFAGGEHNHEKGPHGGDVKGFGDKNHIEAIRSGDEASVFVLDKEGKMSGNMSKHKGGSITVTSTDGKPTNTNIAIDTSLNEIKVNLPVGKKVTLIINVKIDGKNVSAKFNL